MASGLGTALGEITLVLFATMAPAGTFALMIMGAFALKGGLREEERAAVDRFTCVPLVVALIGLVASATHLRNPANTLYVLAGVGRSPLSNEVVSGVMFFGVAGGVLADVFFGEAERGPSARRPRADRDRGRVFHHGDSLRL